MAAYLLTWKPSAESPWEDFPDAIRAIKAGRTYLANWSSGKTKRIRKGDRLFMMRQGDDDPGLIASGHADGKPYRDTHWSDRSKTALYVDVVYDFVRKRSVIPRTELRSQPFTAGHWDSQSSGTSIDPTIVAELEAIWATRTAHGRKSSGKPAIDHKALQHLLDLDSKYQAWGRKEQAKVRRILLGSRNVADCEFCRQSFPVDLLIAAHIKRRADCSRAEKKDFKNNVILLCKFGCDDLFERGYIVVKRGKLDFGRPSLTSAVLTKVSFMRGKAVSFWTDKSDSYFAAHRKRAFESEE